MMHGQQNVKFCIYVLIKDSQQTATLLLYSINRFVFYKRGVECLQRGPHWVIVYNK